MDRPKKENVVDTEQTKKARIESLWQGGNRSGKSQCQEDVERHVERRRYGVEREKRHKKQEKKRKKDGENRFVP